MTSKRDQSIQKLSNGLCHRWYRFVLAYPDHFVRDQLREFGVTTDDVVLDPFVGTGTTCVECKMRGIPSFGIDANPFAVFASAVKTTWDLNLKRVRDERQGVIDDVEKEFAHLPTKQRNLADFVNASDQKEVRDFSLELITEKYVSPLPLAKCMILRGSIMKIDDPEIRSLFMLALASTFVMSANVRFGPEIGLISPKEDAPSLQYFEKVTHEMLTDLAEVVNETNVPCKVMEGDSRGVSGLVPPKSISSVITSPPYPVDKDYTRQTRLEIAILGFARDIEDIQKIKKQMIRSSTRQIYKEDNEVRKVIHIPEVRNVIDEIVSRCKRDGDTSGFSKMYPRLVGEYFGGMKTHFEGLQTVLKKGARCAYVVGDSRSFKMVHIKTAKILSRIAEEAGFRVLSIDLWRDRGSTAHKQTLDENVLKFEKL